MPDKRDMHQAKSHRNSKTKHRNDVPSSKSRGQARMPSSSSVATSVDDAVPMAASTGKRNKSKR
jgi:hypothetical protein